MPEPATTNLPADPILMEQTIRAKIRDILLSAPLVAQYANVSIRGRFPDNEADDISISTKPRPDQPSMKMTSLIQIHIPSVNEFEYGGDTSTQLDFTYPITFDMSVTDEWDNSDSGLVYTNSSDLFTAMYMQARQYFKRDPVSLVNNRQLGFKNCVHDYLQQNDVGEVEDAESGGLLHTADWSLVVHVTSVVN